MRPDTMRLYQKGQTVFALRGRAPSEGVIESITDKRISVRFRDGLGGVTRFRLCNADQIFTDSREVAEKHLSELDREIVQAEERKQKYENKYKERGWIK